MPDLSNLLGAVYGESPKSERDPEDEAHVPHEPAATQRGPAVPDWADDEHLDAAFAQWKPGPAADASAAERDVLDAADDPAPPLADDLAAALSEALVATSAPADTTDEKPRFDFSEEPSSAFSDEPRSHFSEEPRSEHVEPSEHVFETDEHEHDDVVEPPSLTPQRAAAAELTAASRVDPEPEPVVAPPPPEPAPVAVVPTVPLAASVPEPTPSPATPVPAGAQRWAREDDDILPEKRSKGFFSFSLRRG